MRNDRFNARAAAYTHPAMEHEAYFEDQVRRSVPEFWQRMGGRPEVAGKRVLDLGCGHGAMCLELAGEGADVVGVDLNCELVEWAREHVERREVPGSMRFLCEDVRSLSLEDYDFVFSKDTFEHVQDLRGVLIALRNCLASGGQIWAGFSPLFYSPRGAHGEMGFNLPWAHVPSRRFVYWAASRRRGEPVRSLADLYLNGMTPSNFRRIVADAGLRFQSLDYNLGNKRSLTILSRLRRVPALERYATVSIYAVLVPA